MKSLINDLLHTLPYPEVRPEGLYEPIEYVLAMGGKRLRPVLLLLAYRLYRDDIARATAAAVAIETYHNHTLLHDDLMDHADMRRGMPTVHCKWDANTAVLSGDAMLIMAFRKLSEVACSRRAAVMETFAATAQQICEGQQYDVNFERRSDVTEAEYIEMIRLKTAVLLGCAVKIGALIADASDADCDTLYRFTERIGLAFQLQDDYLDTYGDPATFGKKIGGDILCGKKTYLVVATMQRSTPEEQATLMALLSDTTLPAAEKISRVRALYDAKGIPEVCRTAIAQYYDAAKAILADLSVDATPLWAYAESLLGRAQ